ncbi:MAG: 50S ribosome-binding GTPase [Anaerolineales bacterium]|jgi:small GTP-binding protein
MTSESKSTEKSGPFLADWDGEIQALWDSLPKDLRNELQETLKQLPGDPRGWRELLKQASQHLHFAAGDKKRVAIVGPANVGKSTFYNRLILEKQDRAKVSAVPGTTRESQESDMGIFSLIDTPGADAVGAVGKEEREKAIQSANEADVIVVMYDASHGIRIPEQELFGILRELRKPIIVALNKMDLIGTEKASVLGKAAAALGIDVEDLVPLSAKNGDGVASVLISIARSEPGIISSLGNALPAYRWNLAQVQIGRAASTAAAIAITPLPFLDFIPLIGIQAALVLGIARTYAKRMTLARARELIATFGLGLLGRTLFYELAKLGGPPGWLVAAAVAAGTTVAIGYVAMIWFERGVKLSADAVQRISKAVSETIIARLQDLGKNRPQKKTLRERVFEALEDLEPPSQESDD